MARVFAGRANVDDAGLRADRNVSSIALCGVREDEEMTWYAYALSMLAFLADRPGLSLRAAAHAIVAAAQSAARREHGAGSRVEYGGEFHDEYQLAVLFGRNGDELSLADGGTRMA